MREQISRPTNQDGEMPQLSVIKVTTIKLMAQLLQNNVFIDAISSCDILIGLLAKARHIDANIAFVNSLLSTLKTPNCQTELRSRTLDALEAYAIPITAHLSNLPDAGKETPLLSLMLDQAKSKKPSPEDKLRAFQFIVDALEKSAVFNSRWVRLFLAKSGFALEANERLPMCPVSLGALASFFKDWVNYIPVSLFQIHCFRCLAILHITEAIKSNRDLVGSNAGKHWVEQFDSPKTGDLKASTTGVIGDPAALLCSKKSS
ncbi:hypothetical protein LZ30DRAFT_816150 [Colletotrichum cereale]|nr:hypothetical protein LZ30DRAFT_816150 [Colletotrichum cereale]